MAKIRAISATTAVLLLAVVAAGVAAGGDLPFGEVGEDLRNSLNNTTRISGKPPDIPRNVRERGHFEKIFVYEIETKNTYQSDWDDTSEAIARFLENNGLADQCVDLRILKLTGPPSDTYGVVLRAPIPETKYPELADAVCAGRPGCSVVPNFKAFNVSGISIIGFPFAPSTYRIPPEKIKTFQLPPGSLIPTFSHACRSGKFEDSVNGAAGTQESRRFLDELGLDIRRFQALSLVSDGRQLWNFALPNRDRND